jgi:Uma2 family endonuclease
MHAALEHPRPPRIKKWTKAEYLDLVERGAFRGQRVYLFRGDIIEMAPQGHPHAFAIRRLNRYLTETYPPPYEIAIQLPFVTPGESVPEPDAAVFTEDDATRRPHPSHAELIVEVSYSSLESDRVMAAEYAAAQVAEYWIIDVDARRIEVYRQPVEDPVAPFGFRYADTQVLKPGDAIAPQGRPDAVTPVGIFFA